MKQMEWDDLHKGYIFILLSEHSSDIFVQRINYHDNTHFYDIREKDRTFRTIEEIAELLDYENYGMFSSGFVPEPVFGPQQFFILDGKYCFQFDEEFKGMVFSILQKKALQANLSDNKKQIATRRTKI